MRGAARAKAIERTLSDIKFLLIAQNHPERIFEVQNIWRTAGQQNVAPIRFYLPHAAHDFVQSEIALNGNFFDAATLEAANPFFQDGAVILDIGANIGNNALYYACVRRAQKVYAFEPMSDLFAILKENVHLNALENIIEMHNFALGEKESFASVLVRPFTNLGASAIKETAEGFLKIKSLDELQSQHAKTI